MRRRGARRAKLALAIAGGLAIAALAAHPARGRAQTEGGDGGDYDIGSKRWNGLSRFADIATGLGLEVEAREEIDWDEIGRSDLLFLFYPTRRVDPRNLIAFIQSGGHVVLGDDFGSASEVLERLGLTREETAVAGERFYRELPFAPIARARLPEHPLAEDVGELVGNHPAVLPEVRGHEVVFAFGPREAAVAVGDLGEGRFVILSDPSMLINRMLDFDGNIAFAANLLRYMGEEQRGRRLIIMTGDLSMTGEPEGAGQDGTMRGALTAVLSSFNEFLDELNDYLLTEVGIRLVAVVVALLVAFGAALSLPVRRRLQLDGSWLLVGPPDQRTDPDAMVARYERSSPRQNFLLPAAILRDAVNARLERELEIPDPLVRVEEARLTAALEARRGPAAVTALLAVNAQLRALPARSQASWPFGTVTLSQDEFERLQRGVANLYRTLGDG